MLPLLIYFVNADFPLSAEQPLAETMRQLLLDSGLDGGSTFFEKRLQLALKLPGNTRSSTSGPRTETKPQPKAADLETLVKRARTQKELEALMDAEGAEQTMHLM